MNLNKLPIILVYYLLITILLEVLLAFILGLRKKDLLYVILVNIITNPVLNAITTFVYINYHYKKWIISLIIFEILAVLIEGLIYKKVLLYKKINYLFLSLILNIFSYFVGKLIPISLY